MTFDDIAEIVAPMDGVSIVNGEPWTFDGDAANLQRNCQAVDSAPADLTSLSEGELTSLRYACSAVFFMSQHHPRCTFALMAKQRSLSPRLDTERLRRGWLV